MPDQPKIPPRDPVRGGSAGIVCGDCREPVDTAERQGNVRALESRDSGDWYCPYCARLARGRLECAECRAMICGDCGAVLELADELGIG
jgi:hypothetical protein